MEITAALAVDLDLLTQALDLPGTDIAHTLTKLADNARSVVVSQLGLSVALTFAGDRFDITVLNAGTEAEDIHTSLLIPLPAPSLAAGGPEITLILYAGTPGAFVDVAADLAWLSGRGLEEYRLDENLAIPPAPTGPTPLQTLSIVNQAIGVLIGRGFSLAEAKQELDVRAAGVGVKRAAVAILDSLQRPSPS